MLYAQFSGASSLREIEAGLQSHATRLYHVGGRPPRRSSLADANRDRPVAVYSDLLAAPSSARIADCAARWTARST